MIRVVVDWDRLSSTTATALIGKQHLIDSQTAFLGKKKVADELWKKSRSNNFMKEVERLLEGSTTGIRRCHYCENDTAAHIEHFYPKGLYPELTFNVDNYLFVCERCNTGSKGTKFSIFFPENSAIPMRIDVRSATAAPANIDAAIVNPLTMDPFDFLWLNLKTGMFSPVPEVQISRKSVYFEETMELLRLNTNNWLPAARRIAFGDFKNDLEQYIGIKACEDLLQLKLLKGFAGIAELDFHEAKDNALGEIKRDLLSRNHRTVWEEMKRQRAYHPELDALFEAAPEALDW